MNGTRHYHNRLQRREDIDTFILEGEANITFVDGCMEMQNRLDASSGQRANFVLWCPEVFGDSILIEWEFRPMSDRGLCILFFAAAGRQGRDLFDPRLAPRTGEYPQYHSGDIDAFHVSYYRRKEADERAFHTCNLRKSHGFHLVAQGADPIPEAAEANEFYRLSIIKTPERVDFSVNGLSIFSYEDDGATHGARLGAGRIGLRQLAPLTARYRNLSVSEYRG
ncbi:MAG: DUF1961 family protein [Sphaerochaeta sp.]|jgi:hypothetical protein|nr:YesU family protein [Sphaerochaeta sp.]MDX9914447.1 DUF1961 family protein [Sphaerochaeta sp.]